MNRSAQPSNILGAVAGVAFAILFFIGLAAVDQPRGATDQELVSWWSDSGKRLDSMISMYAMLLAGPLFLVFLARLRARLRAVEPADGGWTDLAFAAGIVFAAVLSLCAASRGVIAQAVRFGDEPLPGPDTLRYAAEFSQVALGLVAIPFATLLVAVASALILNARALARWVGWLGLVVVAGSLVAVALQVGAIASPLLMVWVLAVSFGLWRMRASQPAPAESAPAAVPGGQPRISATQG